MERCKIFSLFMTQVTCLNLFALGGHSALNFAREQPPHDHVVPGPSQWHCQHPKDRQRHDGPARLQPGTALHHRSWLDLCWRQLPAK